MEPVTVEPVHDGFKILMGLACVQTCKVNKFSEGQGPGEHEVKLSQARDSSYFFGFHNTKGILQKLVSC